MGEITINKTSSIAMHLKPAEISIIKIALDCLNTHIPNIDEERKLYSIFEKTESEIIKSLGTRE